jgi:hypothetical protein
MSAAGEAQPSQGPKGGATSRETDADARASVWGGTSKEVER